MSIIRLSVGDESPTRLGNSEARANAETFELARLCDALRQSRRPAAVDNVAPSPRPLFGRSTVSAPAELPSPRGSSGSASE
jgi:hypothetical protein